MAPKVSVITTVYNGENFIEECVNSILGQTFRDFEFIIIDDGSTDKTPELLKSFTDPRIKIIRQENQGLSKSLLAAVNLSQGSLIARLDADDFSLPERLEKQVRFLDENPDFVLCGSRFQEWVGGKGFPQRIPFIQSDAGIRRKISCYNPFAHSTVMFRKETYLEAGGYNPEVRFGQDFDLWVRMLEKGKGYNLDHILGVLRFHQDSITGRQEKKQLISAIKTRWKAYRKFWGNPLETAYFFLRTLMVLILPARLRLRLQGRRR